MAKSFTFEVSRSSKADPDTLFALVADGSRWPEWAKPLVRAGSMVAQGSPEPLGVGAVRKLGVGKVGVKEETTAHEPGRLHAYKLITPGPVRDYQAEVRFSPREGGGTHLQWTGTMQERIPGTGKLAAAALGKMIDGLADKLVAKAERA